MNIPMHPAIEFRLVPYRFEGLPRFSREEVV